jgi:hypothetical protein
MTTVELPPDLLKQARLYATARGITFREFIEEALRARLARKEKSMKEGGT